MSKRPAVEDNRASLEDLTAQMREVFWLTEWRSRRILYISPAYESIWGRSCRSLYDEPRSWAEAVHPDDRRRVEEAFDPGAAEGDYDVVYRIVRPDGAERWIHDRAFPLPDEDGNVVRVAGISEDITRRVLQERDLRQAQANLERLVAERSRELAASEKRYRALVETSPDAIVVLDETGRLVLANQRAADGIGLEDPGELIGRPFLDFVPPADRTAVGRLFNQFIVSAEELRQGIRFHLRRLDGKVFPVEISAAALGGELRGLIAVVRDVTKRERLLEQLRFRGEFVALIAELSTELINLAPERLDAGVERALERVGHFADADRAYLFGFHDDGCLMSNTHEWCAANVEPQRGKLQNIPVEDFPWWMERLRAGADISLADLDELPAAAQALRHSLQDQGVVSLFVAPLAVAGELQGFLGLDSVSERRVWSREYSRPLRLVGEHLAAALERTAITRLEARSRKRLEFLSRTAMGFVSLKPEDDLYDYIAQRLREIVGDGYVMVNTFDDQTRSFRLRALLGRQGPLRRFFELYGRRFIDESFPINDRALESLRRGRLERVPEGLYDLACGKLSRRSARTIEKLLGIGAVYSTGVLQADELLGSLNVLLPGGVELEDRELLETFLNQAAVALQRQRSADNLRRSRREYRELIENSPDVVLRFDRQLRCLYANPALVEQFGLRPAEFVGRGPAELDRDLGTDPFWQAAVLRVFETGAGDAITLTRGVGDQQRFFNVRLVPERGPGGAVESVLAVSRDVSELERTSRALRESERVQRALFVGGADPLLITELSGRIVDANPAAERVFGRPGRTLAGRSIVEDLGLAAAELREWEAVCRDGLGVTDSEAECRRGDGGTIPVSLTVSPVAGSDGELRHLSLWLRDISARRRTLDRLQVSERKHRLLLESIKSPIVALSNTLRILYCNKAYAEFVARPVEELEGAYLLDLFPAFADTASYEAYHRALETGSEQHVEGRFPAAGGELYLSASVYPMPWGLLAQAVDITAAKRVELELRESEKRYRFIFAHSPSLNLLLDASGVVRDVNAALTGLLGLEADTLRGVALSELVAPEQREEFADWLTRSLDDDEAGAIDLRLIDGAGGERMIYFPAAAPIAEDGEGRTLLLSGTDLTERRRDEERIRRLNGILRGLRRVDRLISRETDRRRLVESISETLIEYHSYEHAWIALLAEDVAVDAPAETSAPPPGCDVFAHAGIGAAAPELRHKLTSGELDGRLGRALRCGNGATVVETDGDDARRRTILVRLEYGGRIFGLLGVALSGGPLDGAERELLDEVAGDVSLALHNIRLLEERRWAESERERLNQQLRAKNQELEQLIYIAGHDLRSPMVNIQGYSGELGLLLEELGNLVDDEAVPAALREKLLPTCREDIPEALECIKTSVYKMDGLLSGLLRLSRLGGQALRREHLDVGEIIAEIRATFSYRLEEQGARLEIGELPPCIADRTQLNQVFSNLIDNALKYLDPGRPGRISVDGEADDDEVRYSVADNGVGIEPRDQERIFQLFQRSSTAGADDGEGLGLTIVRRILQRHGGAVTVEAEPGVGSRFVVSLPRRVAETPEQG